jgi:hypothetical protein
MIHTAAAAPDDRANILRDIFGASLSSFMACAPFCCGPDEAVLAQV